MLASVWLREMSQNMFFNWMIESNGTDGALILLSTVSVGLKCHR